MALRRNIETNVSTYLAARGPADRYTSFDYCFNYFQSYREEGRVSDLVEGAALQVSCLQLGFYLASWGMYRGSTILLQRSLRYLVPSIDVIAAAPPAVWTTDANGYDLRGSSLLIGVADRIRGAVPEGMTDTWVTKIMLGVFGCVPVGIPIPAFDTNSKRGFGVTGLSHGSLQRVGKFYRDHSDLIERHRVQTLDFETGGNTNRRYTRAKVIDMIFFVEGAG